MQGLHINIISDHERVNRIDSMVIMLYRVIIIGVDSNMIRLCAYLGNE